MLNGRFVLSIKGTDTKHPVHKARFVVQRHTDRDKHTLVHNSSTARLASKRLFVSITAMRRYAIWSFHVTKAYLQSAVDLARTLYVLPPRELAGPNTPLLRLWKILYGLSGSGDYCYDTLAKALQSDIGLEPSTEYPAMYYGTVRGSGPMNGIVVTQVGDVLRIGSALFHARTLRLEEIVESKLCGRACMPPFPFYYATRIHTSPADLHPPSTQATHLRDI